MEENNNINNVEEVNLEQPNVVNEKATKKDKHHNKEAEEIIKLQESLALEKEKSMRIQAEMMNFRRRKEDEVVQIRKYANEDILKELVSIVDNFERALRLETEENKEFLKGFNMIYTNIVNILNENEVKEIIAQDAIFDPNYHQAVLTEHVDGVNEGIVIDVLQKGYTYKDKVLRPAMVKVSE